MKDTDPDDLLFAYFTGIVSAVLSSWTFWMRMTQEEHGARTGRVFEELAPSFLMHTQWGLLTTVVLELSKLCDPESHYGRENLTLERVYYQVRPRLADREDARLWVERAFQDAKELIRSDEFKETRNRVLAHNDVKLILKGEKGQGLLTEKIGRAVRLVGAFHARTAAVRSGEPLDLSTGRGVYPDPEIADGCEREYDAFLDQLERGRG